jgi:hypothetical protein
MLYRPIIINDHEDFKQLADHFKLHLPKPKIDSVLALALKKALLKYQSTLEKKIVQIPSDSDKHRHTAMKWSVMPGAIAAIDLTVFFSFLKWAVPAANQITAEDDPQKQALHALITTIYVASIMVLPAAIVAIPIGCTIASSYRKKAEKEKNKSPWQESNFGEKQKLKSQLSEVKSMLEFIESRTKTAAHKALNASTKNAESSAPCRFDFGSDKKKKHHSQKNDASHTASTKQFAQISAPK